MEPETNQQSSVPQLCKSGCGFYGSSSTDGLCSKCHKDTNVRTSQASDSPAILPNSNQNYDKSSKEPLGAEQLNQVLNLLNSKSSLTGNGQIIDSLKSSNKYAVSTDIVLNPNFDKSPKIQNTTSDTNLTLLESRLHDSKSENFDDPVKLSTSYPPSPKQSHTPTSVKSDSSLLSLDTSQTQSPSIPPLNRCFLCKKKIGLSGFPCRCGHNYCSAHRYSDQHKCQVDYKELAQNEIRKNNPVVQAQKIQKI